MQFWEPHATVGVSMLMNSQLTCSAFPQLGPIFIPWKGAKPENNIASAFSHPEKRAWDEDDQAQKDTNRSKDETH